MARPKLRFKAFDGDWHESSIGQLTKYFKGYAFKSESYKENGVRIIRVSDLGRDSIKYDNDAIFLDEVESSDYENWMLKKHDIVVTTVGSKPHLIDSAVGRPIYIRNNHEGLLNQNLLVLRPINHEVEPYFIFSQLLDNKYLTHIETIQRGNANQSNITVKDLQEFKVFNTSKPEQTKIATFLSAVDTKISQLTQKHQLLSQYKQGMMQKLFSQQIRFKADDGSAFGEWGDYKIFDLAKDRTLNNGVFNDQNKVGKGYKLINVLDMYIKRDIDESKLNLLDLDKKEFEKNKVNYGDIFFTRSSLVKEGIAFSNVYLGVSDDITYDGHLIKLSPDLNMVEPKFLNYCLKTSYVRKQLIQGGKTATMTTIGQQEVGNTFVKIPCLEEQTKIANFLSAIDQKIEVVAQQIEQAKQWKKGLLQQMFV